MSPSEHCVDIFYVLRLTTRSAPCRTEHLARTCFPSQRTSKAGETFFMDAYALWAQHNIILRHSERSVGVHG